MKLRHGFEAMWKHQEYLQAPASSDKPHVCRYRGREFPCSISSERRSEVLGAGGFISQVGLTIVLRRSELDPQTDASLASITVDSTEVTADDDTIDPRPNMEIELVDRARKYRIQSTRLDSTETAFVIDCVDPYSA